MRRTLSLVLTILMLAILAVSCSSMEKKENKFFSISIPSSWKYEVEELPGINMSLISFHSKDNHAMGMVLIAEMSIDPDEMIGTQMGIQTNPLFQNYKRIGDIHTETFLGEEARACKFKSTLQGKEYDGTLYCFQKNDYTVCAVSLFAKDNGPALTKVWETLEWKALKGETGTRPLDTEAADFVTTYSEKLHRMSGVSSDGVTITDIKFHKSQKRFTFVTELSVFSLDAMDKSDLDELESALKEIGSEMVNELGKRNPIIKRCMEAGYNFEFQYLDQDQKELCTLHLTPEDYNN